MNVLSLQSSLEVVLRPALVLLLGFYKLLRELLRLHICLYSIDYLLYPFYFALKLLAFNQALLSEHPHLLILVVFRWLLLLFPQTFFPSLFASRRRLCGSCVIVSIDLAPMAARFQGSLTLFRLLLYIVMVMTSYMPVLSWWLLLLRVDCLNLHHFVLIGYLGIDGPQESQYLILWLICTQALLNRKLSRLQLVLLFPIIAATLREWSLSEVDFILVSALNIYQPFFLALKLFQVFNSWAPSCDLWQVLWFSLWQSGLLEFVVCVNLLNNREFVWDRWLLRPWGVISWKLLLIIVHINN